MQDSADFGCGDGGARVHDGELRRHLPNADRYEVHDFWRSRVREQGKRPASVRRLHDSLRERAKVRRRKLYDGCVRTRVGRLRERLRQYEEQRLVLRRVRQRSHLRRASRSLSKRGVRRVVLERAHPVRIRPDGWLVRRHDERPRKLRRLWHEVRPRRSLHRQQVHRLHLRIGLLGMRKEQ